MTHEQPPDSRHQSADTGSRVGDGGVVLDLSGTWHAAPVSNDLRRSGADPDLDHSRWPTLAVPGHWAAESELANETGPLVYRQRFTIDDVVSDKRYWIRFDGVMSGAEVWLDGTYLGDTVGYFAPHHFEISDYVADRPDHLLAVDVACPGGGGPMAVDRANVSLTGALQTGPLSPGGNPGGIWRPVVVTATGPVAVRHSRLLCCQADQDRGTFLTRVVLDAVASTEASITTTITKAGSVVAESRAVHTLAAGENRLEWEIDVDEPALWWPAALGQQPLYDVEVVVEHDGEVSDRRQWRTGIRQVEMSNLIWRINGERLFLKSIAYGPPGPFLHDIDEQRLRADVALVQEAGFDMMRIFAHISRPEIYQAADELGVLIWQDLPMLEGQSSKVRKAAKTVVREAVDLLGAHPSIAVWGGHVLPNGNAVEMPSDQIEHQPAATAKRFFSHIAPTWNRNVLDSIVGRELKAADATRPVVTRSGSLPSPSDPASSDSFLWLGWRTGHASDWNQLAKRWPRLAAFPGGIGSQTAAVYEWSDDAPTWATAERASFDRYLPRRAYRDGPTWAKASQNYQADVLESHIQILRRLKYRPTGGFCLFALADAEPAGGFGIVDFDRNQKMAWNRVVDACRPVIVVADAMPSTVVSGETISLGIHVINDLHIPMADAVVSAEMSLHDEGLRQSWRGVIDADSCVKVADWTFAVPDHRGPITVDVAVQATLNGEAIVATNRYRSVVIPTAEAT